MSTPWHSVLLDRLIGSSCSTGGWGYRTGQEAAAEPTSLASLALAAHEADATTWVHGLTWLQGIQRIDGAIPATPAAQVPAWPTGLALLAWQSVGSDRPDAFASNAERAVAWLLNTRGRKVAHRPDVLGHNTQLQGWSWVHGTHSWLEPTAYGVLGLRAADLNDHARTREGVTLLWDRMFDGGGWNYGNTRVLGRTLRAFPATTGLVLTALAGERAEGNVEASLDYLTRALHDVRTPMSLGWGLIGLTAWDARPTQANSWLSESGRAALHREVDPLEDALLLLAHAGSNALTAGKPVAKVHADD